MVEGWINLGKNLNRELAIFKSFSNRFYGCLANLVDDGVESREYLFADLNAVKEHNCRFQQLSP